MPVRIVPVSRVHQGRVICLCVLLLFHAYIKALSYACAYCACFTHTSRPCRMPVRIAPVSHVHQGPVVCLCVLRLFHMYIKALLYACAYCACFTRTSRPCCMPVRIAPVSLTPLKLFFLRKYHFWLTPVWFMPTFSVTQLGCKMAGCISF